tara:strand:- start:1256 stop:1948 length:693 start_codon:yes stop_codon:yes gene_type:complete
VYKKIIFFLKNKFPLGLSIYYKFRFVFRAIYNKESRAHLLWILKKGDAKFYKDFDLSPGSIFFDVGGFEGEYTSNILQEYDCKAYIFEPHPVFFQGIKKRFIDNNKVKVFNYGLGGKTENVFLSDDSHGSKVSNEKTALSITIKDISEVIQELQIKKIDLLKLNIEGSEYELLERLIETKEINKIQKIKIQFHENILNPEFRREEIRNKLKNTHKEIWSYYFVWERWDKK